MTDGPNIARIAALLGDPTRSVVLTSLMTDRALTATELSNLANVSKQTISGHLAKLLGAALVTVEQQGRHRYFRLAGEDIAQLIESLMGVAFRTGSVRLLSSPRDPAMRKARVCYDHLAGECGVMIHEALWRMKAFVPAPDGLALSGRGVAWFRRFGINTQGILTERRAFCRPCMDWSERRQHMAGALGAATFARILELRWAKRCAGSRVVSFSANGEKAFRALLNSTADQARR
jgi:DNA-binding transcriptional ArsR family regulator